MTDIIFYVKQLLVHREDFIMMSDRQKYDYEQYMRDGSWYESNAESYERSGDYLTAKSRYMDALFAYEKAYDVANSAGDYAANSAYSRMSYCRSQISEMGYKYDDAVRRNLGR